MHMQIIRLEEDLSSETTRRCSAEQERELILSRCFDWGSLLDHLETTTNRALDSLIKVNWVILEVSQGAATLSPQIRPYQPALSDNFHSLAQDLRRLAWEHGEILHSLIPPREPGSN